MLSFLFGKGTTNISHRQIYARRFLSRMGERESNPWFFYGNDIAIDLHDLPLTPPVGGELVSFCAQF